MLGAPGGGCRPGRRLERVAGRAGPVCGGLAGRASPTLRRAARSGRGACAGPLPGHRRLRGGHPRAVALGRRTVGRDPRPGRGPVDPTARRPGAPARRRTDRQELCRRARPGAAHHGVAGPALCHHGRTLWHPGTAGRRAAVRSARRSRSDGADGIRRGRPGASALDLGVSRRPDRGVDLPCGPRCRPWPFPRVDRRDPCGAGVRCLVGMAPARHPRGSAGPGHLPGPAPPAGAGLGKPAGRHRARRAGRRSLGHLRDRRVVVGGLALGGDPLCALERGRPGATRALAGPGRLGRRHRRHRSGHGGCARHRGAGGHRAQLHRDPVGGAGRPRCAGECPGGAAVLGARPCVRRGRGDRTGTPGPAGALGRPDPLRSPHHGHRCRERHSVGAGAHRARVGRGAATGAAWR